MEIVQKGQLQRLDNIAMQWVDVWAVMDVSSLGSFTDACENATMLFPPLLFCNCRRVFPSLQASLAVSNLDYKVDPDKDFVFAVEMSLPEFEIIFFSCGHSATQWKQWKIALASIPQLQKSHQLGKREPHIPEDSLRTLRRSQQKGLQGTGGGDRIKSQSQPSSPSGKKRVSKSNILQRSLSHTHMALLENLYGSRTSPPIRRFQKYSGTLQNSHTRNRRLPATFSRERSSEPLRLSAAPIQPGGSLSPPPRRGPPPPPAWHQEPKWAHLPIHVSPPGNIHSIITCKDSSQESTKKDKKIEQNTRAQNGDQKGSLESLCRSENATVRSAREQVINLSMQVVDCEMDLASAIEVYKEKQRAVAELQKELDRLRVETLRSKQRNIKTTATTEIFVKEEVAELRDVLQEEATRRLSEIKERWDLRERRYKQELGGDSLPLEPQNTTNQTHQPAKVKMLFETIIGFTLAEATAIVSNDTWFADNVNKDQVQRYIKYETDETGKHVTSITRSNDPADGHIHADKTLDVNNIVLDTEEKIAAFLFSVNANKGPSQQVKKFLATGAKVTADTEKKFLGHVAWLVGNGSDGSDTDLLCQYERQYIGTDTRDLPMLDLSTGYDIFGTELFYAFVEIERNMEMPDFCPKERSQLAAGMARDLCLVNRFL